MCGPDRKQRTRRVPLRGVGIDPEGVVKFAGEVGGPPGSVELSGERLEAYEKLEAKLMAELREFFLVLGVPEEEAWC